MVQLLHKMKVRASNGATTLLKVIKNPVSAHLPPGFHGYGFSCTAALQSPAAFAKSLPRDAPLVFVVGAMAQGHVTVEEHPYMKEMVSISQYPLSGAAALNRLLGAIENEWGVV